MSRPNPSTAMAEAVVDELTRNGVKTVFASPGSRSGALAIAASNHPDVDLRVVLDERSSAFHALGYAKSSGQPAAVMCTSGTAAANFFPAVVEADSSLTPLVVITADRPEELRGVGANQTIDQMALYGRKVRSFDNVEAPNGIQDSNDLWRTTVCELVAHARGYKSGPGPAHLNVAFREPTVPVSDDGRTTTNPYPFDNPGRPGRDTWVRIEPASPSSASVEIEDGSRGIIIAGEGDYDRAELLSEAQRLGWPVLATALSRLRGEQVVGRYHHLLAGGVPPSLAPSAVVVAGAIGPSSRLERLAADTPEEYRVDRWGRHIDPSRSASVVLHGDPAEILRGVDRVATDDWSAAWLAADRSLDRLFGAGVALSGPAVAQSLNGLEWDCLVVGSSLAIRDVDAHLSSAGPVVANRGASGIDGFASTALGAAMAHERTLAFTGDLSLLHDSSGFISEVDNPLTIVVVDNGGGGLFDLLPQAQHAPDFERLFVTPHGRDLETFADFHQLEYRAVVSSASLVDAAGTALSSGRRSLVHVRVDRNEDLAVRAQLDARARELLG